MEYQPLNTKVTVNSASFAFIGFIPYEHNKIEEAAFNDSYESGKFYTKEKKNHFEQVYYANFVTSMFENGSVQSCGCNHFHYKNLTSEIQEINIEDIDTKSYNYKINSIEVITFPDKRALFLIKVDLHNPSLDTIGIFGNYLRKTLDTPKYPNKNPLLDLITNNVAGVFHSNKNLWKDYNSNLKAAIFVDIANKLSEEEQNTLLFSLGTFENPYLADSIFAPSYEYLMSQIDKNSISIFENWKAFILQDSFTRAAVNMNKIDVNRLWENEYIYIYLYVLHTKYFLTKTNEELWEVGLDKSKIEDYLQRCFDTINNYDHTKISYKFLQNEIYEKLTSALGINSELGHLEKKLSRFSLLHSEEVSKRQTIYENRISRVLTMITILTLFSMAYDGGQLLSSWCDCGSSAFWSFFLFFCSFVAGVLLWRNYKEK